VVPIIEKLRDWRQRNGLSQRGAIELLAREGARSS